MPFSAARKGEERGNTKFSGERVGEDGAYVAADRVGDNTEGSDMHGVLRVFEEDEAEAALG